MEDMENFDSSLYRPIIVTFDGTSASGKGTLVKGLSKILDSSYQTLDAGAMYRAITYHYMSQDIDARKLVSVTGSGLMDRLANEIKLELTPEGILILNGNKLDDSHLRGPGIDPYVAKFGELDEVKSSVVDLQRKIVANGDHGWILDGRCMGSAVAPQAQAKFYVDAPSLVRATRRHGDYVKAGKMGYSTEEIHINIERRDELDRNTNIAPLVQPEDAILIDSYVFSPEDAVAKAFKYVKRKIIEAGHK